MAAKIFWVTGLWRGRLGIVPRPRGAEWLDDETRAWREAGVDLVVSLLEPDEEADLDLTGESASAKNNGTAFRAFPIPDRSVPSSCEAVAELADQIIDALSAGKTVVVHCRQSIGRSAMVIAAVLLAGGLDAETAVNAIRQSRGLDVPETQAQRQWISDFSAWLSSRRAAQQQHPAGGASRRG
ncbi:MAG TPA: dual specificity protein phosphatase family protein [Candidatus Acidoferrum sp.]|nr:dual specificity protein phosphatase family protein [Candidatus Acidoferrum sp.]